MPGKKKITGQSQQTETSQWLQQYLKDAKNVTGFTTDSCKITYEKMIESLEELNTLTETYCTPDENQEYPIVQQEDYDKLIAAYQKAAQSINTYRSEVKNSAVYATSAEDPVAFSTNMGLDMTRMTAVSTLDELLSKDISTLITSKTQGALDLPLGQMLYEGRVHEVEYKGELKVTRGGMSSRHAVTIDNPKGEKVEGFFTPEWYVDKGLISFAEASAKKHCRNNPEWEAFFKMFFKATYQSHNHDQNVKARMYVFKDREKAHMDIEPALRNLVKNVRMTSKEKALLKNRHFLAAFDSYVTEVANRELAKIQYVNRGAEKGSIDKRNSAMTAVAELMGFPDALAPSYTVKLNMNGTEVTGTFMGKAKGVDLAHLDPKSDLATKTNQLSLENPEFLKSVANLQAIDYICGNTDRHRLNQLYQLDNSDPPKIVGLQGIDNDLSFCTTLTGKAVSAGIDINQMGFIPESTAKTILSMSPEILKTVIKGYDIGQDEINAACNRLTQLQEAIVEGKMYYAANDLDIDTFHKGHLKVVPDAEVSKISLYGSLSTLGNSSHFARAANTFDSVAYQTQAHAQKDFWDGFNALRDNTMDMKGTFLDIQEADKGFFIGSSSYRSAAYEMRTLMTNRTQYLNSGDRSYLEEYFDSLEKLQAHVDEYLLSKEGKELKPGRETNRYNAMKTAKEILAKERAGIEKYYEGSKTKAKSDRQHRADTELYGAAKQFAVDRAKTRQKVRMDRAAHVQSVLGGLSGDDKLHPEKNMDYNMAVMGEKAANRLAEMRTNFKGVQNSKEYVKEKVRLVATLTVEELWKKDPPTGPIHSAIKDKNVLMEQIMQLTTDQTFMENAAKTAIPTILAKPGSLTKFANLTLESNLQKAKANPPIMGTAPSEQKKIGSPKVEDPKLNVPGL